MSTMPSAGDPAPDFALPDASGTVHRLADRRGRWTVVYFYADNRCSMADIELRWSA